MLIAVYKEKKAVLKHRISSRLSSAYGCSVNGNPGPGEEALGSTRDTLLFAILTR